MAIEYEGHGMTAPQYAAYREFKASNPTEPYPEALYGSSIPEDAREVSIWEFFGRHPAFTALLVVFGAGALFAALTALVPFILR